jgi:TIR domain
LRVFLSFHTPDRALALGVKSAIEAALPVADVYVDQTHLRHGHFWQPSLFDAIAKAQAFLILVSNRIGPWQKLEYYEALDRKAKDDDFVLLPIMVADRAKGPAANLPGLAQLQWIESTEPTAPDPLAKIVAALQSRAVGKPPEPWRFAIVQVGSATRSPFPLRTSAARSSAEIIGSRPMVISAVAGAAIASSRLRQ